MSTDWSLLSSGSILARSQRFGIPSSEGIVILARPVHELVSYAQALDFPPWVLIARVIKTLFLALIYRHFYDRVYITLTTGVIQNGSQGIERTELYELQKRNPFLLENAVCLRLNVPCYAEVKFVDLQKFAPLTPESVRQYFLRIQQVQLSLKVGPVTHWDLIKSPLLERTIVKI